MLTHNWLSRWAIPDKKIDKHILMKIYADIVINRDGLCRKMFGHGLELSNLNETNSSEADVFQLKKGGQDFFQANFSKNPA